MAFRRKILVNKAETSSSLNIDKTQFKPIGVTIPFNNPNGIFNQSYTHRAQIMSNLQNLLMTAKGERYMEPEFGTDIRLVLFENITTEEEFEEKIKNEITSAISFWLPYLSIQELTVNLNMTDDGRIDDPSHAISIRLLVFVTSTNIYLPINIFISESGNLTIEEAVYNE